MRIMLLGLLIGWCSCTSPPPDYEWFPERLIVDNEWVAYEGILPSENGDSVLTELFLKPASFGLESYYKMHQSVHTPEFSMGTSDQGKYVVLMGANSKKVIQIVNRTRLGSVIRGKMFEKGDRIVSDLFLRSHGDHEFVLVDENFNEIIPRFTLRRRSELFTVEGYLTVYEDTVEFFEKNTRKKWSVAQYGHYEEAVKKYHVLAKVPHEGIYVKALSYSTPQADPKGNGIDALVFKKILHIDSMVTN